MPFFDLPHNHILRGKALEELCCFSFSSSFFSYFFAQLVSLPEALVHLFSFFADETLGKRLLDVITAVDKEEVVESRLHIALSKALTAS